jgi:hypothetical protein
MFAIKYEFSENLFDYTMSRTIEKRLIHPLVTQKHSSVGREKSRDENKVNNNSKMPLTVRSVRL